MPHKSCLNCGDRFYVRPCVLKKGYGKYCSKRCSNLHNNPAQSLRIPEGVARRIAADYEAGLSLREAGEKHGYGRGGAKKVLERMDIEPRTISEALRGREFSEEHRQKISDRHHDVSGRNNPMFGITPSHGKWVYVPHLSRKVRSTWEAIVAQALHECEVPHEYEPCRIEMPDCTYTPDFFLPDHGVYIEVKGWVNSRWKRVLKALAQHRPSLPLVIIGEEQYKAIVEDPAIILEYL